MISSRSRYRYATVERGPNRSGDSSVSALNIPSKPALSFNFTYYQWTSTDRVDHLARYFFDDETMWWIIANSNPEILVWDEVEAGTIIRIPRA
jgi:hypothetical protein